MKNFEYDKRLFLHTPEKSPYHKLDYFLNSKKNSAMKTKRSDKSEELNSDLRTNIFYLPRKLTTPSLYYTEPNPRNNKPNTQNFQKTSDFFSPKTEKKKETSLTKIISEGFNIEARAEPTYNKNFKNLNNILKPVSKKKRIKVPARFNLYYENAFDKLGIPKKRLLEKNKGIPCTISQTEIQMNEGYEGGNQKNKGIDENYFIQDVNQKANEAKKNVKFVTNKVGRKSILRKSIFEEEMEFKDKQYLQIVADFRKSHKNDFEELKKSFIAALNRIFRLNLNISEVKEHSIFSFRPFQKKGSYEFIRAAKMGRVEVIKELLEKNKFLVFDFDYVYYTALHWAAKRGHLKVVLLLAHAGGDIDCKDLIGRTPLYFAVKYKFYEICLVLLYFKASPWSYKDISLKEFLAKDQIMKGIIQKARKLDILLRMSPYKSRKDIWERERFSLLLDNPFTETLTPFLLKY